MRNLAVVLNHVVLGFNGFLAVIKVLYKVSTTHLG